MTAIEIVLIVIGCIIIMISFRLIGKSDHDTSEMSEEKKLQLTEENEKEIKDRINELVNEVCEDAIVKTDDYLSKISNEKIMSVNEFSDQILEKINTNHQEVVFLYHMLNDKEEELKKAVAEINTAKRKIQEIIEVAKKGTKNKDNRQITSTKTATTPNPVKKEETKTGEATKTVDINHADQKKTEAKKKVKSTPKTQDSRQINTQLQDEIMTETQVTVKEDENHNDEILSLYKEGQSIVEISKSLNLGQGEVKLVIDLYNSKKGK